MKCFYVIVILTTVGAAAFAQTCRLSVVRQIGQKMVFARAFQIEKVSEEGFSTPTLRATWQLHFPECYSSIIVTFLDPSNKVVGEATITENITITTEVTQMVSVCNERVRAIFKASDGFTIVEQRSPRRVYAGGNPNDPPAAPPPNVQVQQDLDNPQRIVLSWSPLQCSLTNSPITSYIVELGRRGEAVLRRATTSDLSIKSSASTTPTGLGFLDQRVVYYFRVAAQNKNGVGPFSSNQLGFTANRVTEQPVLPTTIPPPTTAPPPTSPAPPPTTAPPPVTTILPPTTLATPLTTPALPPATTAQQQTTSKSSSTATPISTAPLETGSHAPPTFVYHTTELPTTRQQSTPSQETDSNNSVTAEEVALGGKDMIRNELSQGSSVGSGVGVGVAIALVLLTVLAAVVFVVVVLLWNHRKVLKKHSYNVRAMDDTFLGVNRQSFILSMNTPPPPSFPPLVMKLSFEESTKALEPSITSYKSNIYSSEGEEVTLQVDFKGNPEPAVTWFFNGIRLDDTNCGGQEVMNDGSLHVPSVTRDHAGTYDFVISNSLGSVEGCTKLIVYLRDRNDRKMESVKTYSNPVNVKLFGEHVARNHEAGDSRFTEEFENLSSGEAGQKAVIGRSVTNRHCNRFRNILCYDTNRIQLEPIPKHPELQMDYINASYVDGFFRPKSYIATQAPLAHTIPDFWHLIWQEKVQVIVMLNSVAEGRLKKSEIYWPEGSSREYGPFTVTLVECQVFADYTARTMMLQAKEISTPFKSARKITQFHFTSWPDSGVPEYAGPLLMFQRRVKTHHKPGKGPLLIHCDGGVARTGTYITIDNALGQVAKESVVDIAGTIYKLRKQRMKMVQGKEQYVFIHDAVLESLMCGNTQIPAASMKKALVRLSNVVPATDRSGFQTQFNVLEQVAPNPSDVVRTMATAYPEKNRSSDFLPSDKWRVVLKAKNVNETYIHASYANGYKQKKGFIIAQSPMSHTAEEFWKMVYEKEVVVIVMLSQLEEDNMEVCHQYWPSSQEVPDIDGESYGFHSIYTLRIKKQDGFIVRNFGITSPNTPNMRKVTQFQMSNWNRDGICTDPHAVMKLIDQLLIAQRRTGNKPILIHGVDTVTRCGVFCSLLSCIEHCKTEGVVDVFQIVKGLRIQKPGLVQTVEQYQFIHELMQLFLSCFSLYSNFK